VTVTSVTVESRAALPLVRRNVAAILALGGRLWRVRPSPQPQTFQSCSFKVRTPLQWVLSRAWTGRAARN